MLKVPAWHPQGMPLHSAGYAPLRSAIATYLGISRGVQCTPEQVIIVSGSQQAIDLAARVLLDPDDAVWMEDPGYPGGQSALLGVGARLVPVAVDAEGLDVAAGMAQYPNARMVYVTPSYQFPLGATSHPDRLYHARTFCAPYSPDACIVC